MEDEYSATFDTYTIENNMPIRLTMVGMRNSEDKIEMFYDKDLKRWDVTIVGNSTEAFESFIRWAISVLPVCKCQRGE